jgi:hypothetical protein
MALVCTLAALVGDRLLRAAAAIIAAAWTWGLAAHVLTHSFVGTGPLWLSDGAASLGLTALWLVYRIERVDLFAIAALQVVQSLLEALQPLVDRHPLRTYYVEYNALNLLMLGALLAGAVVCLVTHRRRTNDPAITPELVPALQASA